jgi:hypothetical protein
VPHSGSGGHDGPRHSGADGLTEYVADVPLPDPAPVPGHLDGDVVLRQGPELRGADRAISHAGGQPVGQLVMPDKRVPADELSVRIREIDEFVGLGPVIDALRGLDDLPFHPVARRDHGELAARDRRELPAKPGEQRVTRQATQAKILNNNLRC